MFKEDGGWWVRVDGVKTTCGDGAFIEVFIYATRQRVRRIITPLFCMIVGHSWRQEFYYYECDVCHKKM